jgi:ribonuclease HI
MEIYIDGACKGNPGIGGWGVFVLTNTKEELQFFGGASNTTNNQMELQAGIAAMSVVVNPDELIIYTDSKYLKNGIEIWVENWKKNNWLTAAKKPVKNKEQWQKLDLLNSKTTPEWRWVKGHSGDYGNDKADMLANRGVELYK